MFARLSTCLLAFGLTINLLPAFATAAPSVGLADATGNQRAAPAKLTAGLKHGLKKGGFRVVGEAKLAESDTAGILEAAAADLGIAYLVRADVARSRSRYEAEIQLIETTDGSVLWTIDRRYRKSRDAWKTGETLGWLLARKIRTFKKGAKRKKRSRVVAASSLADDDEDDDEVDEDLPRAPRRIKKSRKTKRRAVIKDELDEDANEVATDSGRKEIREHPEDRMVRLAVGGGGQLSSAYTVAVGEALTGLAYVASPSGLLQADVQVRIPKKAYFFEGALQYVPLLFNIDTNPAVTPNQPGARHLDFHLTAGWSFKFNAFGRKNLELAPLLGLSHRSLKVQAQEPYSVIIGAASWAPQLGGRLAFRFARQWTIDATVLGRLIVGFSEGDTSTGDGGSGTGFALGLRGRYWLTDWFAAQAGLGYDYTKVGLSDAGTRVTFAGDPALVDATVYQEEVRLHFGAAVAF